MLAVWMSGGGAGGSVRSSVVRLSVANRLRAHVQSGVSGVGSTSSTAVPSLCRQHQCNVGGGGGSGASCGPGLLASAQRRSYASYSDQLKGNAPDAPRATGGASSKAPAGAASGSAGRPMTVLSADREFLRSGASGGGAAAGLGGGLPSSCGHQMVLIHDHRDLPFLKKITAAGVFGSLMSSSGLAYAVSIGFGPAICGGLALQTCGAALMLMMYLRTTVARAVLDPRRSQLTITGCNLFGEPLQTDQQLPLAILQPGYSCTDQHIKFRVRGSVLDPLTWIWYRMPRAQADGSARKPGTQLGFPITPVTPALPRSTPEVRSSSGPAQAPARRFMGAGLGGAAASNDPFAPAKASAAPSSRPAPMTAAEKVARYRAAAEEAAQATVGRRSLASLKLHHGLPATGEEEQKILDFLEDPLAFGAQQIREDAGHGGTFS